MIVQTTVLIDAHTCGECGITFGMDQLFIKERKKDKRIWYCPNGHIRIFVGKSHEQKLSEARADANAARHQAEQTLKQNARLATDLMNKAKELRTIKRRSAAGLCTKCNRSFKQLRDHMASKHTTTPRKKAKR
jgi:hypothetical protein